MSLVKCLADAGLLTEEFIFWKPFLASLLCEAGVFISNGAGEDVVHPARVEPMGLDRSYATMITAGVVVAFAAITAALSMWFFHEPATASIKAGQENRTKPIATNRGPSGLPVPRLVSLKRDKVNVRRGPSTSHKVSWVFTQRGYPVEIIAESDHWRRIRDAEGEEGWVFHSLLSGGRTAVVSPWRKGSAESLLNEPSPAGSNVVTLESGVLAAVNRCTGQWCRINVGGYSGWLKQDKLWGVYPGEQIE